VRASKEISLSFSDLSLHPALLKGIDALGFTEPTPIQSAAIPAVLEGRDLLACAETGSGKTAAFLLPILHQLMGKPRGVTRALVLSPTRELAQQIADDLRDLAAHAGLRGAAIYGGVGMGPQREAFTRGVDVIVATPGRLLDHFSYPYAKLPGLELLVLDEADRMLDMGFLPDVKRILRHLPPRKQTLFFSATMPAEIAALTREILKSPVEVKLARTRPKDAVTQSIYPVAAELKAPLLAALLEKGVIREALVFTRTKHRADRLAGWLVRQGIAAERIHGNRSQSARQQALDGFKRGKYRVLVATDIAARGIDVEELGHVVNFDVPGLAEDYVHRVGRTGRASATGDAFTLVSPQEQSEMTRIERVLGVRVPRKTLEGFDYTARPEAKLEVSRTERIAGIREQKARERANRARSEQRRQRPHAAHGGHAAQRAQHAHAPTQAGHGDAPRPEHVKPHRAGAARRRRPGYARSY
jgi:ATP-dependent RNA helicase RhlE